MLVGHFLFQLDFLATNVAADGSTGRTNNFVALVIAAFLERQVAFGIWTSSNDCSSHGILCIASGVATSSLLFRFFTTLPLMRGLFTGKAELEVTTRTIPVKKTLVGGEYFEALRALAVGRRKTMIQTVSKIDQKCILFSISMTSKRTTKLFRPLWLLLGPRGR
jgi:hypothetical protein